MTITVEDEYHKVTLADKTGNETWMDACETWFGCLRAMGYQLPSNDLLLGAIDDAREAEENHLMMTRRRATLYGDNASEED
jgi:hypothetical protein